MIEVSTSQSGAPFLVVQGRYLSSSLDPHTEAEHWVNHYEASLQKSELAFCLGLGSGYHVAALTRRFAHLQVIVFEAHAEIITTVQRLHNLSSRVRLVHVVDGQPFDSLCETNWFRQTHSVLLHQASCLLKPELYDEFMLFLTAHHGHYTDFYAQIQSCFESLRTRERAITILDLEKAILSESGFLSEEARIWLILRELVK